MTDSLTRFGQILKRLRKQAGLKQLTLAKQLVVDPPVISNWERAYQYGGRDWKPNREQLLALIKSFAGHLSPAEAQQWAALAGYQFSAAELAEALGGQALYPPRQLPPLPPVFTSRPALETDILTRFRERGRLALVGGGGMGKTTLAAWLAQAVAADYPDGVVWVGEQAKVGERQRRIALSYDVTLRGLDDVARAAELRTLLAGKKILLVLDDLWYTPALAELRVVGRGGGLLITSRDRKVADTLALPLLAVDGLTADESAALLAAWGVAVDAAAARQLAVQLGGLPLALNLLAALLRAGELTVAEALASLSLAQLAQDEPQNRFESVRLCFDLSWERLAAETQPLYAVLGVFGGPFEQDAAAAVWELPPGEAQSVLRHLARLSLLQRQGAAEFGLHPLLRDYARDRLAEQPEIEHAVRRQHARYYIGHYLAHPGVIDGVDAPAPPLDAAWPEVVVGVRWAVAHEPRLAAMATVLAHTERPALLEAIGPALPAAVARYAETVEPGPERALLHEILADLALYQGDFAAGLGLFEQTAAIWGALGRWLDSSRALVRAAGVQLLQNEPAAAADTLRMAQQYLAAGLPLSDTTARTAYWLFYWFDVVYYELAQWRPLPEQDVIRFKDLADATGDLVLQARGITIYCAWCSFADRGQSASIRQQAVALAVHGWRMWRTCGRQDRADDLAMWTNYRLKGRFSRQAAARYARRRSGTTPRLSLDQVKVIPDEAVRWWSGTTEAQRVKWLSQMLPRYLGATNAIRPPLQTDSRAWRWVDDILAIGSAGTRRRRWWQLKLEEESPLHTTAQLELRGFLIWPLATTIPRKLIQI